MATRRVVSKKKGWPAGRVAQVKTVAAQKAKKTSVLPTPKRGAATKPSVGSGYKTMAKTAKPERSFGRTFDKTKQRVKQNPENKQNILVDRAARVGKVGPKAVKTLKSLKTKAKTAPLSAAEQQKLTDIQARRKAAKSGKSSPAPKATPDTAKNRKPRGKRRGVKNKKR